MNNRTVLVLAGALVVLVLLATFGQRQQQPETQNGELFLPGLQDSLDDLERIEIIGSGSRTVATLERGASGWTVLESGGYPADLTKTRHALLSLAETQILEAKTANPALHNRLGVEDVSADTAGGVAVRLVGLSEPLEVVVGDTTGDYQRYVRRSNEDQSYLINRDPEIATSAADWLDTAILDIDGDRIKRVQVTHENSGTVVVFKEAAGTPNFTVDGIPDGRELRYASIANVMGNVLEGLTLDDVEPFSAATEGTTATNLVTFDGLAITVELVERDDTAWASFTAAVDPELPADAEDMLTTAQNEAAEINARVEGWRYQIPTSKYDQLTRDMSDLLKAEEPPVTPPQ
jgi:hypothetical protein